MKSKKVFFINLGAVIFVSMALLGTFVFENSQVSATESSDKGSVFIASAEAATTAEASAEEVSEDKKAAGEMATSVKFIAAALAIGMAALATGIAQSKIGAAGVGAMAEKPEVATMCIVMLAIPETIVILGFVVAAMITMF